MPQIRPFRALRYDPAAVEDIARVVAPPYDVVGPEQHRELLARHPRNVIRLDLPSDEPGDDVDDRYRRAAKHLAAWRSDGTFHKDAHPSIYVYEQAYRVPGSGVERIQRGFFARLRLEAFGSGSGVLPHERTLAAPKEDRYRLLRATGVNTSPVVGLYSGATGVAARTLDELTTRQADVDVTDDEDTRHRLWVVPADGDAADAVGRLIRTASAGPVTLADGHHRYETAIRYRDERRMSRSCEEDPAFDYVLMLFLDATAEPLTILPTHRVVSGGPAVGERLLARAPELFEVRPTGVDDLQARFGEGRSGEAGADAGVGGRFGLVTGSGAALLEARRPAFEPWLPASGEALRRLDVTLLEVALERLIGIDREELSAGRVNYTHSVAAAVEAVTDEAGEGAAAAALLLEPTPVASVLAVARDGDVMPQKSTYFYPKALTGLVINPLEW